MAVLVIAGSGRNAGKTAVGCALVRALEEFCWTAVKVTPHVHGLAAAVYEELDLDSQKDTGRYLAAGAKRAFLLEGERSGEILLTSLNDARNRDCSGDGLLVESNRINPELVAGDGERSLCLALLNGTPIDWKGSLLERAARAQALVLTGGFCCDELPLELRRKRAFQMIPGQWSSPELIRFVRGSLHLSYCDR
jgi:hypothetical protein